MFKYRALSDNCVALCESIRVYSGGEMQIQNHLNWGALQGTMSDVLYTKYSIILRIVDTRVWKSDIVGTSKPDYSGPTGIDPKKWPTVQYVLHGLDIPKETISYEVGKRARNYSYIDKKTNKKYNYDTDICDAICIALYGLKYPINKLKRAP